MAAVVSAAIQRINELIIQHAVLFNGVHDEMEQLQLEIKQMQFLVQDTDYVQQQDQRVQNWVAEIRDLIYEAEDVIDTFLVKVKTKRSREGVRGFLKNAFSNSPKQLYFNELRTQIKSIKDRIWNISTFMQDYGVKLAADGVGEESSYNSIHRRKFSHIHEEHLVHFDAVTADVETQLMREEEQLRVVSIVGMGGLGKTTLAKKVYNQSHVMQHFDCCSWLFVSQRFSMKDVIVGIMKDVVSSKDISTLENILKDNIASNKDKSKLKKLEEDHNPKFSQIEIMKEDDLVRTLRTFLEEKRYLVVLDDIWTTEAWECLKPAFPNGKEGSKVLLTTRNREVARLADPSCPPIEPPLLTDEEGWNILKKKAWVEDGYALDFETLGRDMVKTCGGLPLAIVILGGLLATKSSLNQWEVIHRNVNSQFTNSQHGPEYGVYGILSMSYQDLPFHLKPCFLYLAQFPEDSEIHKKTLIRMWIAEGFISQSEAGQDKQTMEDLGEEYFEELVNRSMVEVSQMDRTGTAPKTCRIHELVKDMCISIARGQNFLEAIQHKENAETNNSSSIVHSITSKSRRIAVHPRIFGHRKMLRLYVPLLKSSDSHLRSLVYHVEPHKYEMSEKQKAFIFKSFRLLRVLIIDNVLQHVGNVPREIGNLIHLRYLGLRRAGLYSLCLPSTVGNLRSLYTLDLRLNLQISLPNVLQKLESLRHLLVDPQHGVLQLHEMEHLETLKKIRAKSIIRNGRVLIFPNLRNLGLTFSEEDEVLIILKHPIFGLGLLRSLEISNETTSLIPLQKLYGYHHLTKLKIEGAIPDDLERLPTSLAKLTLINSQLKQDPMKMLEKLPNLRFLHLGLKSYEGWNMVCSASGFPQLQNLEVYGLQGLKEWEIEEGAMPCVKTLCLGYLKQLRMIPQGLKFITTIKDLKLVGMRNEVEKKVQLIDGVEGEDFHTVRHIPSIIIINPK